MTTRLTTRLGIPELWIAAGCGLTLVLWALPPLLGVWVSAVVALVSLVAGALAGVVYHLRLHAAVSPMPRGWWWNPTAHHDRLSAVGRRRVMPFFLAGAAGCGIAVAGSIGFLSAVLRL